MVYVKHMDSQTSLLHVMLNCWAEQIFANIDTSTDTEPYSNSETNGTGEQII